MSSTLQELYKPEPIVSKTSKGDLKYWRAFTLTDGHQYYTSTEYWQEKSDGTITKAVQSAPKVIQGKNIGRSNETTPEQQAEMEVMSAYRKKLDREGYVGVSSLEKLSSSDNTDAENSTDHVLVRPMLAHPYEKRSHNITWPAYAQPKLDGIRCLYRNDKHVQAAWSRQAKPFIAEVFIHLSVLPTDGYILDGELMLPQGKYTFQDTTKAIKKYDQNLTYQLEYHVYDLIPLDNPDMTYCDRHQAIKELLQANGSPTHIFKEVPAYYCRNEKAMKMAHAEFISRGYEGTMIRNVDSPYKIGHRSADLQKYKDFLQEEYVIVGCKEGQGNEQGCAVFECTTDHGKVFSVRPVGTVEARRIMYSQRDELIGKMLTVKYQELTDDRIPRFPVGVAIRDYE